ncbi:hypothetical protein IQ244_20440 [Nostoc sp. LEGE 06077]|uniref:hypothetical protein n=1 Tax=Nostoc sp. LEGE 06077 TaxID=915325 RepID=UPI00187F3B7D|nr:hypothetical protein [Nostoc sp. LEGE 06077]MBE9208868.1 hypothetical protein [Nostoc sp. LEGE 06077]
MILNFPKHQIFFSVKVISVVLISSAISLELWNIYTPINKGQTLTGLNIIMLLGRLALIAHFLEAIIASIYAHSKNRMPLRYGIYTFFVGTIALLELFRQEDK